VAFVWESPVYRFKDADGNNEILINVTGSAPHFKDPGKLLEKAFGTLLRGLEPEKTEILDFGGAKLRNTLYLLRKGYAVTACEFGETFERSKQASGIYEECKTFPNFRLVLPKDFPGLNAVFDVALLINVINTMPVPEERSLALTLCREKMHDGARLLWYTQHGKYSADDAVAQLNDGLVTGKGREFHMFYRDFTRKEIHGMLNASGFRYDGSFASLSSSGAIKAYVFIADGACETQLLDGQQP
jgi:hypothetical protein